MSNLSATPLEKWPFLYSKLVSSLPAALKDIVELVAGYFSITVIEQLELYLADNEDVSNIVLLLLRDLHLPALAALCFLDESHNKQLSRRLANRILNSSNPRFFPAAWDNHRLILYFRGRLRQMDAEMEKDNAARIQVKRSGRALIRQSAKRGCPAAAMYLHWLYRDGERLRGMNGSDEDDYDKEEKMLVIASSSSPIPSAMALYCLAERSLEQGEHEPFSLLVQSALRGFR